jgi:electron transport complex protein RnfC
VDDAHVQEKIQIEQGNWLVSGKGNLRSWGASPQRKMFSGDAAIEIVSTPDKVILPLLQHIGGPCILPAVKPKQEVVFGDMVGKGEAFVSASLHSPVNGIVQKMAVATLANGRHVQAIAIHSRGEQLSGQDLWDQLYGGKWPQKTYQSMAPEKISAAIHEAGIVGLGGAAFPTHVKITPDENKPIHTLIVNGCECESPT